MSTAERRGAPEQDSGPATARGGFPTPAHAPGGVTGDSAGGERGTRALWVDDTRPRRRMPDAVRGAAVRAMLIVAVTLVEGMVAFLSTLAGSWLAFPMVISSVASTVVATWAVLDVWITRQVWHQRNGVVSAPSSSARALRKERRGARRQARKAARARDRIEKTGHAGRRLSHT